MSDIVLIIVISVIALALVIGLIVGLVKGFTETKTWATEYLFTVVLSVLIYALADTSGMPAWGAAALKLGTAVAFILVFALLSSRGKALFKRCIAENRKRSYYKTYGEREENVMQILDAIESGDEKAYKKLTNRKFKESSGAAGVANRICGGLTLIVKVLVIFAMIALVALVLLDFTQLEFVDKVFGEIYAGDFWQFISKFAMDAFVIGLMFIAIRSGFRSGIAGALWVLAVIALIGGAGYLSYWLCFNVPAFQNTAAGMTEGALGNITSSIADFANGINLEITATEVAQVILAAGIFLVLFIIIIIAGIIVAGIISRAREGKAFGVVDGVLGAVVALGIVVAVMLFAGSVLFSISDVDFMEGFNSYMWYVSSKGVSKDAVIASVFYQNNPLNSLEFMQNLPVRGWFG